MSQDFAAYIPFEIPAESFLTIPEMNRYVFSKENPLRIFK